MGRRSRKRSTAGSPAPRPVPPAAPRPLKAQPKRRARMEERPPAPWDPFPLVELAILIGLIFLLVGFFIRDAGGSVLVVGGLILVFAASLELTIREHFGGFRSHSSLLALASAFLVGVPLYVLADLSKPVVLAVGAAVGATAFIALRTAFQRRAGGLSWRS